MKKQRLVEGSPNEKYWWREKIPPQHKVNVRRNRTAKTISASGLFFGDVIGPLKLSGDYKRWKALEKKSKDIITFRSIEKMLSQRTRREVRELLKRYAVDEPHGFSEDVHRFCRWANTKNPEVVHRARGRTTDLGYFDLTEVRVASHILYEAVCYWLKQEATARPNDFSSFEQEFRKQNQWDYKIDPIAITRWGIERYFRKLYRRELLIGDDDTFVSKYIYGETPRTMLAYLREEKFDVNIDLYRCHDGSSPTLSRILK